MRSIGPLVFVVWLLANVGLSSCGQTTLLSDVHAGDGNTTPVIHPNGSGDATTIAYRVSEPALVSVYLTDAAGKHYVLRDREPRVPMNTDYALRFDGTVRGTSQGDMAIVQQVLPNGTYHYIVQAESQATHRTMEQQGTLEVRDAATKLPLIEDLHVEPQVVSPNEDAIDDVTTFSYHLPITSTVSIAIQAPDGPVPFISDVEEGPYAQSHIWDGKRQDGSLLASGTYTYTVTARDTVGNVVQRKGQIRIDSPGRSEAQITYFNIAPTNVELGGVITATIKVKNTGNVPIRTQGPAVGYRYTTHDIFSSIDGQQWASKGGGFWRVAVGYDGGPGYPFRWAMTNRPLSQWNVPNHSDLLQPGEEVKIVGTIQLLERQSKMYFYAGLAHEGVGYPVDRMGVTLVKVGF